MIQTLRQMKTHRLMLMGAVLILALSTCAPTMGTVGGVESGMAEGPGEATLAADAARIQTAPASRGRSDDLSTAGSGVPAPVETTAAPIDFPPVVAQRPKLRIDGVPADRDIVAEVMSLEGVAFATSLLLGEVTVGDGEEAGPIRVAAVDPAGFRVLTPQVTADAVEVWQRLIEGDAAFTHDTGHRLSLPLGSRVPTSTGSTLRVGAYASNGVPPVADAIITKESASALGIDGPVTLLVSLAGDARPDTLAQRIREITGGSVEILEEPVQRRAFLTGASARNAFEPFTYVSIGDGMIQIDRDWVRRNIVYASVPVFRGQVLCHRLLIPQLRGALQEVVDRGLDHLIDPTQYGGCWVPRHIDFNPSRALSMHSWGLAVDFNVSTNQLGQVPQMDRRIVEIFERWGFVWGGHWRRPDGMHFELGALLQSPGG